MTKTDYASPRLATKTAATWYAAIDRSYTGAVYAVARTPAGALRIARGEAREPQAQFVIVPISSRAVRFVRTHGGSPSRELVVSRGGVCLRDEE